MTRQKGEHVSMWTSIGWPSTSKVFTKCVLILWSTGAAATEATLICTGKVAAEGRLRGRSREMLWRRTARREPRAMRWRGGQGKCISWNLGCSQRDARAGRGVVLGDASACVPSCRRRGGLWRRRACSQSGRFGRDRLRGLAWCCSSTTGEVNGHGREGSSHTGARQVNDRCTVPVLEYIVRRRPTRLESKNRDW